MSSAPVCGGCGRVCRCDGAPHDGKSLERAQALGVLAHEAPDAAPVPKRAAREEAPVGDSLVVVDDDRVGYVPALPAGLARAVGEVDVVAVQSIALIEAAELLEHFPP